ncbi:hypothetical protein BBR47_14220 [Brevibacillus brevis NBRC 100599]|uniref:Uncharacterized protein n=1 Tax=Brevibacillus brevis (strain 47 / JCM 6285 / NBRC 100599) TaxID=358681 RepID=C0Z806_BREBN|nr:hypothetical protein BBR47_14220 [Brevibacillus brevis NBRC 100599]
MGKAGWTERGDSIFSLRFFRDVRYILQKEKTASLPFP